MNLDDLLRDTLADDRWALPVPADTLSAVRRKRAARRRTQAVGAVLASGALVGGGAVAASQLGGGQRSTLQPAAPLSMGCDAAPPATPIPGSTPAYPITAARDWFMSKQQSDGFFEKYQQPSPGPHDRVPSPQASGPGTDRLLAALGGAGVPGIGDLERDEADSGERGALVLRGKLADGRALDVYRRTLTFPMNLDGIGRDGSARYTSVADVPNTGCASLVFTGIPGGPGGGFASVVTPDGQMTTWYSAEVPLAQLTQWAYAAAQWETENPTS